MKITWIGHSCFKFEKDGYTVIIDPYQDGSVPGLAPIRESADLVICTHEHADHNGRDSVCIQENGTSPFTITEFTTWHDDAEGTKRGQTKIVILNDGKEKVAHLGDLGCDLKPEQLAQLKEVDVLLIPVGGYYTIDAEQAAHLTDMIQPDTVIPMHFRDDTAGFGYDVIGTVDQFVQCMGSGTYVEKSSLDTEEMPEGKILILQPQNRINKDR